MRFVDKLVAAVFIAVVFSCACVESSTGMSSKTFKLVKSENGSTVCAVGEPFKVKRVPVDLEGRCGVDCVTEPCCRLYNYKRVEEKCELFYDYQLISYDGIANCVAHQVPDDGCQQGPQLYSNLALNKPAYQSSNSYLAHFCNDGNRNPDYYAANPSCSHTTLEDNPWWAVDLGRAMCVLRVIFVNRGDCCGYRSSDFIVGVTNQSPVSSPPTIGSYTKCGQWNGAVGQGATVQLQCKRGASGRYVIVQLPRRTHLNFCELEVYGCNA